MCGAMGNIADGNLNPLIFSISGGDDAAAFALNPTTGAP